MYVCTYTCVKVFYKSTHVLRNTDASIKGCQQLNYIIYIMRILYLIVLTVGIIAMMVSPSEAGIPLEMYQNKVKKRNCINLFCYF